MCLLYQNIFHRASFERKANTRRQKGRPVKEVKDPLLYLSFIKFILGRMNLLMLSLERKIELNHSLVHLGHSVKQIEEEKLTTHWTQLNSTTQWTKDNTLTLTVEESTQFSTPKFWGGKFKHSKNICGG